MELVSEPIKVSPPPPYCAGTKPPPSSDTILSQQGANNGKYTKCFQLSVQVAPIVTSDYGGPGFPCASSWQQWFKDAWRLIYKLESTQLPVLVFF